MAIPIVKASPLVTIATFNLCKNFGNVNAVLNLSIPHGVTYGLLGPNGAGKTTTVRMLNAIIPPSGGCAIVAGFDVVKNPTDVKRHCGFLPESPGLYSPGIFRFHRGAV